MEHIHKKIEQQQPTYSKGFKKIATYFFSEPKLFAVSSATQAGKEIGVSETTIIRFCHRLGYKGYSDLQQDVQNSLFQKSSLSEYVEEKKVDNNSIKSLMLHDVENIHKLMNQVPETDLDIAVTKLSSAERVLVSGAGSSQPLANWFTFALDMVIGNTRTFSTDIDNILIRLKELNDRSVFVAFSFHRYSFSTINSAKLAKRQGAYIISITDSRFAPIAEVSDLILPIQMNVKSTLDAAPVVFSLMNSIVATISLRNPDTFDKRVEILDTMNAHDFFV